MNEFAEYVLQKELSRARAFLPIVEEDAINAQKTAESRAADVLLLKEQISSVEEALRSAGVEPLSEAQYKEKFHKPDDAQNR
jgi:hypothetical protein